MIERRRILIKTAKSIDGRNLKTAKLDEDGEVIWAKKEMIPELQKDGTRIMVEKKTPEMKTATVLDMLRGIIFSVPDSIAKGNDSIRKHRLFNAILRAEDEKAEFLELHPKIYDWIHSILRRPIPVSATVKVEYPDQETETYGHFLWDANESAVIEALRAENDDTPFDDLAEAEDN